ncbi:MAG TPA: peptidoglycan-binding domain-containing protein [Vineibacter sp.]|nr:peptidoglycan-binding domain-containing protein [Vineibacter sp.]
MKLKSGWFKGDTRLELAASNSPPMRMPERHASVEKLKIVLWSWGHMKHTTDPTRVYGPATKEAVISFQRSMGLKDDGVVGHYTMTKLDDLEYLSEMPGLSIVITPGAGPYGPYIGNSNSERETRRLQAKQMRSRMA